jgi:hypothetical protein
LLVAGKEWAAAQSPPRVIVRPRSSYERLDRAHDFTNEAGVIHSFHSGTLPASRTRPLASVFNGEHDLSDCRERIKVSRSKGNAPTDCSGPTRANPRNSSWCRRADLTRRMAGSADANLRRDRGPRRSDDRWLIVSEDLLAARGVPPGLRSRVRGLRLSTIELDYLARMSTAGVGVLGPARGSLVSPRRKTSRDRRAVTCHIRPRTAGVPSPISRRIPARDRRPTN